ncbi:MAG: hypothetical protein L0Y74_08420 [candidate division Zixibacteria bacterium]|nr:hypothetical protein [candidate division Zixibacteria bacterium]
MADFGVAAEIIVDPTEAILGSEEAAQAFVKAFGQIQATSESVIPRSNRQVDELSKTINRMANSRAPQLFMGALTSSAIESVPALRGSAAAVSLLSTAIFGLQRIFVTLLGPTGAVIAAIGLLAAFASKAAFSGKSIEDLTGNLSKLTTEFVKLNELGIQPIATKKELEHVVELIKAKIALLTAELEGSISPLQDYKKWIDAQVPALRKLDEVTGLVDTPDELRIKIEKLRGELEQSQKSLDDWNTKNIRQELDLVERAMADAVDMSALAMGVDQTFSTVADRRQQLMAEITELMEFIPGKAEEVLARLSTLSIASLEAVIQAAKAQSGLVIQGAEFVVTAAPFEDEMDAAIARIAGEYVKKMSAAGREVNTELAREALKFAQTWVEASAKSTEALLQISSSFEDMFAQMLLTGKAEWDKLLQYWAARLIASAVFQLIASFFGVAGLGGSGFFGALTGAGKGSFQSGTHYVPRTGLYKLHEGEAVFPAQSNPFMQNVNNNNFGGNVNNYYVAPDVSEEMLDRLIPILKRRSEVRGIDI